MESEILRELKNQIGDVDDFVWSRIEGTVREMVALEIDKGSLRRSPGRPRGRRNFGAPDYWEAVEKAAKTAPVSSQCWPNSSHWRGAFFRCGMNQLLVSVEPPEYSRVGDAFAHINAPWRYDRQPFDALDLRIAKHLVGAGSATAAQFAISATGADISSPHNKVSVINDRFKNFEALELAVFDPSITVGHAGAYHPRWYRPTEKLADILLMM
jgi:hypothetical protein